MANKAEKFVKKCIDNAPCRITDYIENGDISMMEYYVWSECNKHLNLESGYQDVPDKNMPPEYKNAISKYCEVING